MKSPFDRAKKMPKHARQEKLLAKRPGARQQVNSGRTSWRSKRDVRLRLIWNWLIEARTTDKARYTVEKREFEAIRSQALLTPPGCLPGMQVDIQDLSLMIVELRDWDELEKYVSSLEEKLKEIESKSHRN